MIYFDRIEVVNKLDIEAGKLIVIYLTESGTGNLMMLIIYYNDF